MKQYILPALFAATLLTFGGATIASARGFWGGFGNATPEEIASRQTQMFEAKAELLGVSVDEIKNAWAEGKTISELALEQGITEEELKDRMQAAHKEHMAQKLQTLVEQGVITDTQRNKRLEFMSTRLENVEGKRMRHGFGGHFGF